MRIKSNFKKSVSGYTLVMVMVFTGIGLIILTSAMRWTSTAVIQTERNNEFYTSLSAAESATEKVLAQIGRDYKSGGEISVSNNMGTYAGLIPSSTENSFWTNYQFNDAKGLTNKTYVQKISSASYKSLQAQFTGLKGFTSEYRVISNAKQTNSRYKIPAAVEQDIGLASIPIFQFAIFYNGDLEVNPGQPMNIHGRVHSNGNIWNGGSSSLTYWDDVTAVQSIIHTRHPMDPSYGGSVGTVTFDQVDLKKTNEVSITLPVGSLTNNIQEILKVPPSGESRMSELGVQRYYNKAELIIIIKSNSISLIAQNPSSGSTSVVATSTSGSTIPPTATSFLSTSDTFFDQRENKTIKITEIDVAKLGTWSSTNTIVQGKISSGSKIPLNSVYVSDQRPIKSTELTAVRLVNAQTLPDRGLTVATDNPLYVQGHFNADNKYLATDNTSTTKPASLVSDALTVLSSAWVDSQGASSYTSRKAKDTTINAAVLTGIVSTTNSPSRYSGGVQNVARFLEDWDDRTLTYNGSIVVLFDSLKANSKFQQPGSYYAIPDRNFNFDENFMTDSKLPPGTPEVRALVRLEWMNPPPGRTNYVKVF